jgi:hypothetical protein
MSNITATIENVTPEHATQWLQRMVKNRNLKDSAVIMYANDMLNGKWLLSPQGIAFDEQDRLIDGQHRLRAIIRSGLTIPMLVLRGFPISQKAMKTMDVLDSGATRTIGDRLRLMGTYHTNPNLTSAIARQISLTVMGQTTRAARKVSIATIVEIIRIWKAELVAVCTVLDRPQFRHGRNGYVAAAFTLAAAADPARLDLDMGRFLTGAGLESGSPLLELRNLLFSGNKDLFQPREKTAICLAAIYCAWNDIPGRAFLKPESATAAIAWFRKSQPKRFSAVEKLFTTKSQDHSPTVE